MAPLLLPSAAAASAWLVARGARGLTADSRRLAAGDAFIAWPGAAVDARRFVAPALAAGATACLIEADGAAAFGDLPGDGRVAALTGLKAATGSVASDFFGDPSARLSVVACTGTNGKTSTAWWTAQALAATGRRCGVVGTLGIGEPPPGPPTGDADASAASAAFVGPFGSVVATGLTTPDPVTFQHALRRFADTGIGACAVEASSIGIAEERLVGTRVAVAQFTNFTQDHLDYHGSMEAYWQAKARLFAWPGLRAAVVNVDDGHGAALAASLASSADAAGLDLWTCSTRPASDARLRAEAVVHRSGGLAFVVREGEASAAVATAAVGAFNVANLLGVVGGLRALGVPLADAAAACARLGPVPGRMQRVPAAPGEPQVVVDYAHTPDALEQALLALQPLARERGGALWCVFGCGGNRDATKRPLMGAVAARLARRVVVTSDNPRLEPAAAIIEQIVAGVGAGAGSAVTVIESRAEAIGHAVAGADACDVVLIAGKGHEEDQDVGGTKTPFSDAAVAGAALRRRREAAAC